MPRIFHRVLTFKVEGEIYDTETKPEDIIREYNWGFMSSNYDDDIHILGHHKDNRGKITSMIKLPKIHKYKKPDTEFFLI
jgi:hypothetical protein